MTITELETLFGSILSELSSIMSFGLGALTAIAFVIASAQRWR